MCTKPNLIVIGAILLLLALACGSGSSVQPKEESAPPAPEQVDQIAPTAIAEPSTDSPAEAQPVTTQELTEETRRTYLALVFVQSSIVMLEEIAKQVEAGESSGFETLGQLIGVAAILKAASEVMAGPAPDQNLQAAWEQGAATVPLIQQVVKRWTDKEISAVDVPQELGSIKAEMDNLMVTVEQTLAEQYGADPAKVSEARQEAMAELQKAMSEPATETESADAITEPAEIKVDILSTSDYVDSIDYQHIVGEVQNNSEQPVNFVKVIATFYDDAGNVVGTQFSYTQLDVILPGQKSPFDITSEKNSQATKYELQLEADPAETPTTRLKILSANDRVDDIGYWSIAGEVANEGDAPVEFVKIVATFYDAQGQVAGTSFTYSSLDTIPAGGKSPFEVSAEKRDNFVSYELQVQGD